MKNLAGLPSDEATEECRRELRRARIEIVESDAPTEGEVKSKVTGKLGVFTFRRAWYYWCVYGCMPIEPARALYADPVGRDDVRVAGHCGCPPPEEWASWRGSDGEELVDRADLERQLAGYQPKTREAILRQIATQGDRIVDDPSKAVGARLCVTSYHVDSEVGLRLLADAIHELTKAGT